MELAEALRRRRMVRRYDPDRAVDEVVLDAVLDAGLRAPSAGHTQAVTFLVLTRPDARELFWSTTADPTHPDAAPDRWLRGMRTAPALVLVTTSREAYLDRYAEPDKGWTERDESRWSAPYWHVDAGMAAHAMLLRAVDLGLGACFFGVPADRAGAVREAYGVPDDRLLVGVVSLGHPAPDKDRGSRGSTARRPRRPYAERVRRGTW